MMYYHSQCCKKNTQNIKLQVWVPNVKPLYDDLHLNSPSQTEIGLFLISKCDKCCKCTQMCNTALPVTNELQGKEPRCWLRERQSDHGFWNAGIHVNTISSKQSCRHTQVRQISEITREISSTCIWYKSVEYQDKFHYIAVIICLVVCS